MAAICPALSVVDGTRNLNIDFPALNFQFMLKGVETVLIPPPSPPSTVSKELAYDVSLYVVRGTV